MSYAFWCSACKKDHAGECPPAKASPPGYTIELLPAPVTVGSLWMQENFRPSSQAWEKDRDPTIWRVVQVFVDYVDIESISTGTGFQAPKAAFTAKGFKELRYSNGTPYRMVPSP